MTSRKSGGSGGMSTEGGPGDTRSPRGDYRPATSWWQNLFSLCCAEAQNGVERPEASTVIPVNSISL